jgi:hypothetical protein
MLDLRGLVYERVFHLDDPYSVRRVGFSISSNDEPVDAFEQAGVIIDIAVGDRNFTFGILHGFASDWSEVKSPGDDRGFIVSDCANCLSVSEGIGKSQEIAKSNGAIAV